MTCSNFLWTEFFNECIFTHIFLHLSHTRLSCLKMINKMVISHKFMNACIHVNCSVKYCKICLLFVIFGLADVVYVFVCLQYWCHCVWIGICLCYFRFIVRIMCSVLGLHVRQNSPRLRDKTARLYICNHVTHFDHNMINLLTSCNTVSECVCVSQCFPSMM